MGMSRDECDALEAKDDDADSRLHSLCQRGGVLALLVLLATVLIWAEVNLATHAPESLLVQARRLIDAAAQRPPAFRADNLRDIEQRLREYLCQEGADSDAGRLLLATTLALRTSSDPDAPVTARQETQDLFAQIRPEACSVDDLLTAIPVLAAAGQTAAAEGLIQQALDDSWGRASHARALRLAAGLRYRQGRMEVVLDHCWELLALVPDDPEPWRLMARVHQDRGNMERFVEAIWHVIHVDPGDAFEERLQLIDALITLGDRKQASAQYASLETLAPERLAGHPWLKAKLLLLEGPSTDTVVIAACGLGQTGGDCGASPSGNKLELSPAPPDE
jgi:tetratricopeptide (TPR) repeat protein